MRPGIRKLFSILAFIGWGILWLGVIGVVALGYYYLAHSPEIRGNPDGRVLLVTYAMAMFCFMILFVFFFQGNIFRKARELWDS